MLPLWSIMPCPVVFPWPWIGSFHPCLGRHMEILHHSCWNFLLDTYSRKLARHPFIPFTVCTAEKISIKMSYLCRLVIWNGCSVSVSVDASPAASECFEKILDVAAICQRLACCCLCYLSHGHGSI
ncbi:hypothetical protein BKA61DRAFT_622180 [Leptodontidium sp. MPI-SDFR-AT-0119]|nr:hypothetical protein BKA61DRAFT_622180 [Leptodontidium sp. MPI-SDFR-AT-0119]